MILYRQIIYIIPILHKNEEFQEVNEVVRILKIFFMIFASLTLRWSWYDLYVAFELYTRENTIPVHVNRHNPIVYEYFARGAQIDVSHCGITVI